MTLITARMRASMTVQATITASAKLVESVGSSLLRRLKASVVAVLDASPPTNPVMDMPALAPSRRIMM